MNLALFLSGTGSNFIAIAEAVKDGLIPARISLVASNKPDAPGILKAAEMGLPTAAFVRSRFEEGADFAKYMLDSLREREVDMIALAGYLRKIPPKVIRAYHNRIVNIHPALLPKFGGKGMYGMKVHRAVIEAGESESGVTVHYVDSIYDHGEIIKQRKVPLSIGETPESLAAKLLDVEHKFYPEVLSELAENFNRLNQ